MYSTSAYIEYKVFGFNSKWSRGSIFSYYFKCLPQNIYMLQITSFGHSVNSSIRSTATTWFSNSDVSRTQTNNTSVICN